MLHLSPTGNGRAASPWLFFIFLLLLFAASPAHAQTSVDFFNPGVDRVLPPRPCREFDGETSCNYATQKIAVDAAGNAIALWSEAQDTNSSHPSVQAEYWVMVSHYTAASNTWTAPVSMQNEQGTVEGIGFDGSGNAIAVWSQFEFIDPETLTSIDRIRSARYVAAQGTWTPASQAFRASSGVRSSLAVSRNGDAFLFGEGGSAYFGIYNAATKTWRKLDLPFSGQVQHPRIASDNAGNAVAVYINNGGGHAVRYARYDAVTKTVKQSGVLDIHFRDSQSGVVNFSGLSVAMDQSGKAMAFWQVTKTVTGMPATRSIRSSRYLPASGTWTRKTIPVISSGKIVGQPELAADLATNAHAVWVQFIGLYAKTVYAKYSATSGTWSTPRIIQFGNYHSRDARIATDLNNNVFATWSQRSDGGTASSTTAKHLTTAARFDAARGRWGVPRVIQDLTRNSYRSELGIDSKGRAIVLWPQDTDRFYPGGGPRIKELRADRLLPE